MINDQCALWCSVRGGEAADHERVVWDDAGNNVQLTVGERHNKVQWHAVNHKKNPCAFNAIPDTNHNANPTNPNRYSKGTLILPTLLTLILDTVVNKATHAHGFFLWLTARGPVYYQSDAWCRHAALYRTMTVHISGDELTQEQLLDFLTDNVMFRCACEGRYS